MARSRRKHSLKVIMKVAKKFWRYMQDCNQLVETRLELRSLYENNFLPVLEDPGEKSVKFCSVLWCFRSRNMKVIRWTESGDREKLIYLKPKARHSDKESSENMTEVGFAEVKKILASERYGYQLTKV